MSGMSPRNILLLAAAAFLAGGLALGLSHVSSASSNCGSVLAGGGNAANNDYTDQLAGTTQHDRAPLIFGWAGRSFVGRDTPRWLTPLGDQLDVDATHLIAMLQTDHPIHCTLTGLHFERHPHGIPSFDLDGLVGLDRISAYREPLH